MRTKLEATRTSWREKTASLNFEKDITKLWRLTKLLNDEESHGQKITLEENGTTLTGKKSADLFAKTYAEESDITTTGRQIREARTEREDRGA